MASKKAAAVKMVRVKAIKFGIYLGRRRVGDVFNVPADMMAKKSSWLVLVDDDNNALDADDEPEAKVPAKVEDKGEKKTPDSVI